MVAFLPLIAGFAGSFLPGIIDALASSRTKEEAAAILAPEIQAKVAELVGRGMRRDEAEAQVTEGMQGEIQAKMQEGSLPAWAEMGLGLVSGLGAGALAAKLGKTAVKGAVSAAVPEAAGMPAAAVSAPASPLRAPFPKLGHEPVVGSPPPPMPRGPQDEFRDFLRQETRAEPNTPPVMLKRPFPRLEYDEAADLPLQMRNNPELY